MAVPRPAPCGHAAVAWWWCGGGAVAEAIGVGFVTLRASAGKDAITGERVVSLLTSPGRGALAVVGVAGRGAVEAVAASFRPRGRPLATRDDGAVVFGRWEGTGESTLAGEDLLVVRRSEESLEVHCHGGLAATERVIADLEAAGCRRVGMKGWLSATAGGIVEAEIREAISSAAGPRAAGILARQFGLLAAKFEEIERLLAGGRSRAAAEQAERLLAWKWLGLRLTRPWRVVVAGPVNAGKSSLVNAIAGFSRSLVSPSPGTTRDLLETRIAVAGWDLVLVDTAGERGDATPAGSAGGPGDATPLDATEQEGIARAAAATAAADLVLRVVPADAADGPVGMEEAQAVGPAAGLAAGPVAGLAVLTKSDLRPRMPNGGSKSDRSAAAAAAGSAVPTGPIPTSAATGEGIGELLERIVETLVPAEPSPAEAVPITPRQVMWLESLLNW